MTTVETHSSAADRESELRELVAQAGQVLNRLGIVDYLGHCSARVKGTDRVVVKPKHSPRVRSMGALTGADMIVVDLDGNQLEGTDRPPAEVYIHTEIYRARPDVSAIWHTHQVAATTLGLIGKPLLPLLHIPSTYVDRDIPAWPCARLVTDARLGAELATALGEASFCHLLGHGVVTVGVDVEEVTVRTVLLEQLAETNLRVLQIGTPPWVIPDDQLSLLRAEAAPTDGRWAYYRQLVEQQSR